MGPHYMPTVTPQAIFMKKAVLDFKWHSLEISAWYVHFQYWKSLATAQQEQKKIHNIMGPMGPHYMPTVTPQATFQKNHILDFQMAQPGNFGLVHFQYWKSLATA